MDIDNLLSYLLSFIGILIFVLLSAFLTGAGSKQKKRKQELKSGRMRMAEPEPQWRARQDLYANERPLYSDMRSEQAEGRQATATQSKKKKKSIPALQTEGKTAAEVTIMQKTTPGVRHKSSYPVFSENPAVNGIVWAEILTRGGTKRKLPY